MKKEKMEKKLKKLMARVGEMESDMDCYDQTMKYLVKENESLKSKARQLEEKLDSKVSKVEIAGLETTMREEIHLIRELLQSKAPVTETVTLKQTVENLRYFLNDKADKENVANLENILSESALGLEKKITDAETHVGHAFSKIADLNSVLEDKVGKLLLETFADGVKAGQDDLQKQLNDLKHKVNVINVEQMRSEPIEKVLEKAGITKKLNGGTIDCNKTTSDSFGITQTEIGGTIVSAGITASNKPPIAPEGQEYVRVNGRGWILQNKPNLSVNKDVPTGFKLLNIVDGNMHIKDEKYGNEYMIPHIDVPEGKELVQTSIGWEVRNKPTQWQVAPEDLQGWKTPTDYAQQFLDRVDGNVFNTTEEKAQAEKLAESVKWLTDLNKKYANNIGGGLNLNGLALHSSRILLDMMNRIDNAAKDLEKLQRNFDDEIGKMNAVEYPMDDAVVKKLGVLSECGPEEFAIKHDIKPEEIAKEYIGPDPLDAINERLNKLEQLASESSVDVSDNLRHLNKTNQILGELRAKTEFLEKSLETVNKNQDTMVSSVDALAKKVDINEDLRLAVRERDLERFDLLEEENNTLTKQWKELTEGVSRISIDINEKVDAVNVWVNDANRKITGMYKRLDETDKLILDKSPLDKFSRRIEAIEATLDMKIIPALGMGLVRVEYGDHAAPYSLEGIPLIKESGIRKQL